MNTHAKFVAVIDSDEERMLEVAKKYNVKSVWSPSDLDVTGVVIATPAYTHYRLAREYLTRGLHVLVEKPMCLKTKEADELIRLAREQNLTLMVGHTFLYNPAVHRIKEYMTQGILGDIHYGVSQRTFLGPDILDVNVLWDLGVHDVAIFTFLFDELPSSVDAYAHAYLDDTVADVATATLFFSHNKFAHIYVSWRDYRKIRSITVAGSKAVLYCDSLHSRDFASFHIQKFDLNDYHFKAGDEITHSIDVGSSLDNQLTEFVDCIINRRKPLTDGEHGRNIVQIIEAACSRAATGKPRKL